jgi:hypothetical protein
VAYNGEGAPVFDLILQGHVGYLRSGNDPQWGGKSRSWSKAVPRRWVLLYIWKNLWIDDP